jgi:hypothetical protein
MRLHARVWTAFVFSLALATGTLAHATEAFAEQHGFRPGAGRGPSISFGVGRPAARGGEAPKLLLAPVRRSTAPQPPADLPIFTNPLKRRHMALSPKALPAAAAANDAG